MPNFDDVLNTTADSITRPPPKPPGTYLASVTAFPEMLTRNTKDGEKSILSFKIKLVQPQDDVSQDDFALQPDISSWFPLKLDFWLDDLNALKRFLIDVLHIDGGDRTIKEMLAETPGKTFLATIELKPYTRDGEPGFIENITKTMAA